MISRRRFTAALVSLAVAALPAGVAGGVRPRYGGALRVLLPAAPAETDPARAVSAADLATVRAAHATLLEADGQGGLHPGLLEALPEAEGGGRTWRLRLLADLRFHDGQPLGAAEVAASLARLAGPSSAHAWLIAPVEGAAAVRDGRASQLAGVQVISDRDLRIVLSYPFAGFAHALAALPSAVVRQGARGGVVGAGPFRPAGRAESGLRFDAFDAFHGGRPFADTLVLAGSDARAASRALASGAAEAALRPEPLDGRVGAEAPPVSIVLAIVSRKLGPAAEPVRNALAALDRRDLTRFIRAPAAPLSALLPAPLLPAAPSSPAGPRGSASPPGKLGLLMPEGPDAPRAAAARIQVKLYDRGVRAALESAPLPAFAARLASGDFEAALVPIWLVSRDPALALAQVAAAVAGPESASRALARAVSADGPGLSAMATALEAELLAVPLYASGLRLTAREGVEGLGFRADGTLELGDAWLMPGATRGRP